MKKNTNFPNKYQNNNMIKNIVDLCSVVSEGRGICRYENVKYTLDKASCLQGTEKTVCF